MYLYDTIHPEREKKVPDLLYRANVIPKSDKSTVKKENYRTISLTMDFKNISITF